MNKDLLKYITKNDFRNAFTDMATLYGWKWHETYDSRQNTGFPDLVLAKNRQVLFAKLKTETGVVTEEEQDWVDALGGGIWRPRNMDTIHTFLSADLSVSVPLHCSCVFCLTRSVEENM